jgi:ElaB/YqjD/DUF883 family membrane-anchored ribosome-binding protein
MASPDSPIPGGVDDGHTEHPAHRVFEEVCQQAAKQLERVRHVEVGKLVDDSLTLVRKHPGAGVALAAFVGFCLGRLWRR